MAEAQQARKRTLAEVDAEIAQVKKELEDVHGEPAEVYARIVGYYRSVKNWNKGKREEYGERKMFREDAEAVARHLPEMRACRNEAVAGAHKKPEAAV